VCSIGVHALCHELTLLGPSPACCFFQFLRDQNHRDQELLTQARYLNVACAYLAIFCVSTTHLVRTGHARAYRIAKVSIACADNKPAMHILLLTYEYICKSFSGNGIHATAQVRALRGLGQTVTVLAACPADQVPEAANDVDTIWVRNPLKPFRDT
jgi:hypothetical protein